ncbi:lysis system i-spanin subunit Rz [Lysobacter sp. HA35]
MNWLHLWQTLLAWPVWIKLGVVAAVAVVAVFPTALAAVGRFVRLACSTELGRAVLLITAAIVVCQFRAASAFADGRAVERTAQATRAQDAALKSAQRELALTAAARDEERKHAAELAQLDAQHEKEIRDATTSRDRTIADLRRGALRLRPEWSCAANTATAPAGDSSGAVDAAELRRQGAADLVRLLDSADADIRYWQGVARADRAVK